MLKRLLYLVTAIFAVNVHAQTVEQVVNHVMNPYLKKYEVPGAAVMVFVDGKPSALYYGYANRDAKTPINKETIFELGSITKLMTTLLLAQEVDYAKMKLNAPVTKYIPTLPASFNHISVRSLATHTSGLPFELPDEIKNRVAWEKYAESLKLDAPDTVYLYSNVGIGVLGEAIEAVTHQSFNQLYRSKILTPLGMQPIGLTVAKKLNHFLAKGYDEKGSIVPPEELDLFPAGYGVKASADDMNKFLSAAIGLPQTPESVSYPMMMTQTPYVDVGLFGQGLGWQIHLFTSANVKQLLKGNDQLELNPHPVEEVIEEPVFNGNALIDKAGMTSGFRTYIAVIPAKKTGIVILTNRKVTTPDIAIAGREILFKLNGIS